MALLPTESPVALVMCIIQSTCASVKDSVSSLDPVAHSYDVADRNGVLPHARGRRSIAFWARMVYHK